VNARRTLTLAAAALFALGGCADLEQPTLSAPEQPSAVLGGLIDLNGVLQFSGAPSLLQPRHAEKYIVASEGGFVELQGFRVDIPAGALSANTTVTIDLPTDLVLAKRVIAEFGPHGTQFSTPVTLSFPLTDVNLPGSPIEVGRWENGGWTSLGGSVNSAGTVLQGTTPHFSTYGAKVVMAGG
jgi:hypothetical protein